jgi:hypothetical protein
MPTPPTPPGQQEPQLAPQTLTWLAERPTPAARILIHRVWNTLLELQRSGCHPNPTALSALIAQLLEHQPSPRTGHCRACPHHSWRRRWQRPRFPCMLWITTDLTLRDPFRGTHPHSRKSSSSTTPR